MKIEIMEMKWTKEDSKSLKRMVDHDNKRITERNNNENIDGAVLSKLIRKEMKEAGVKLKVSLVRYKKGYDLLMIRGSRDEEKRCKKFIEKMIVKYSCNATNVA